MVTAARADQAHVSVDLQTRKRWLLQAANALAAGARDLELGIRWRKVCSVLWAWGT